MDIPVLDTQCSKREGLMKSTRQIRRARLLMSSRGGRRKVLDLILPGKASLRVHFSLHNAVGMKKEVETRLWLRLRHNHLYDFGSGGMSNPHLLSCGGGNCRL